MAACDGGVRTVHPHRGSGHTPYRVDFGLGSLGCSPAPRQGHGGQLAQRVGKVVGAAAGPCARLNGLAGGAFWPRAGLGFGSSVGGGATDGIAV